MTRKHYEMIAATLNGLRRSAESPEQHAEVKRTVLALAATFKRDNSRFDRARFIAACGYSEIG